MGYYYNTRSPYDVQYDQGLRGGFEVVKKKYEDTKPLRGVRAKLDIRPIKQRDRTWERIIKVSDNEYYITNNAYTYHDRNKLSGQEYREHNRCITYKLEGEQETIIVHAPRKTWGNAKTETGEFPIDRHGLSAPSNMYFYHFNLPAGLNIQNIKSDKFLQVEHEGGAKYYTMTQGDITLTRKLTEKYWTPLVVHRIIKRVIDRKKSKAAREQAKPLLDYLKIMLPLVEHKWHYGNLLLKCAEEVKLPLSEVLAPQGDEVPAHWYNLAQGYKAQSRRWDYGNNGHEYSETRLEHNVLKDLYMLTKPFKTIEVPLGEIAHDRYKNWN